MIKWGSNSYTDIMNTTQLKIETTSASIELIKTQYPEYYKAWKSMLSNYGKESITVFWRGTMGLMLFIEETSAIPNAPSSTLQYADSVKLKRIDNEKLFSIFNVSWVLSKVVERKLEKEEKILLYSQQSQQSQPSPDNIVTKTPFRRIEDKEERLEELFTKSMDKTLSLTEEIELNLLSEIVVSSTSTEVTCTTSNESSEFLNKRWNDI